MVWRTADNETQLISIDDAERDALRKMGNYDRYPREVRDELKESRRRG